MTEDRTQHLRYPLLRLFLLACAAVLAQGYHFGVDDGEIYIPAIKKVFNPRLYPFGAEFFESHAHLSLFSPLVGYSARLLHVSVESAVLFWHVGCIFLILIAGWQLAQIFFRSARAHWGAVALLAALLPVPVAGTALVLSDNYLSARSFSAPFALLSIGFLLRGRLRMAFVWLVVTAFFHPQMAVYCAAFLILYWYIDRSSATNTEQPVRLLALAAPSAGLLHSFSLQPATGAYQAVLYSRTYFFAYRWHWYEWIGAIAPLLLLALVAWRTPRAASAAMAKTSRALIVLGVFSTVVFLVFSASHRFDNFTRLQPMRMFHLVYLLMFVMLGGLIGEYVLQAKPWRWIALFVPLALGMFALDRSEYAYSPHIELPGRTDGNAWLEAFAWARANTPVDAVFALTPNYMAIRGEDVHGFRALADRSMLADAYKDSGAVTMFPRLLDDWQQQEQMLAGWRSFGPTDFERLSEISPVTWVIVERRQQSGLDCPYSNGEVAVCRIVVKP
ncbi:MULTISPECIES: DUF6798 domain-containing protein [Acidobacteriaceae]|uniref:DUF6798 domain-containing protein n=1 Tax=Acidobacteriaceae TaxID=204434 RepID=UPI00131D3C73|nr:MULTISPECIES: DUF6798 domain-containing protein [Acidobacteriaceae]MDW5265682.1 DUF6798 domain-containing protein [Edaphobacter sp.]